MSSFKAWRKQSSVSIILRIQDCTGHFHTHAYLNRYTSGHTHTHTPAAGVHRVTDDLQERSTSVWQSFTVIFVALYWTGFVTCELNLWWSPCFWNTLRSSGLFISRFFFTWKENEWACQSALASHLEMTVCDYIGYSLYAVTFVVQNEVIETMIECVANIQGMSCMWGGCNKLPKIKIWTQYC